MTLKMAQKLTEEMILGPATKYAKVAFPTRAIALLVIIAFLDLISTAVLYSRGVIDEANPLMRIFISQSPWLFAFVKGGTLVVGWYFLAQYSKTHLDFVRRACLIGTGIYVAIWLLSFITTI